MWIANEYKHVIIMVKAGQKKHTFWTWRKLSFDVITNMIEMRYK